MCGHPVLYNNLISYILCRYKYIAVLDTDEIIIPTKVIDWKLMMDSLSNTSQSTYFGKPHGRKFRLRIEKVLKTKQSVNHNSMTVGSWRFPQYYFINKGYKTLIESTSRDELEQPGGLVGPSFGKSILNPEMVKTVYNHGPIKCFTNSGKCKVVMVSKNDAKCHHFRTSRVQYFKVYILHQFTIT